jgi:hypothetical protein
MAAFPGQWMKVEVCRMEQEAGSIIPGPWNPQPLSCIYFNVRAV